MTTQINQRWTPAQLPARSQIDGAFVLGFRITGDGTNDWSARFNRFKFGTARSRIAGIAVMKAAIGSLLRQLFAASNLAVSDVAFAPALGSAEATATPTGSNSALARACANVFGNPICLDLLSKRPHESLHRSRGAAEARAEIIRNADYRASKVKARAVIVFDDFITRGDTLGAIANAIKSANPSVLVFGVALAKNQGIEFIDPVTANDHLLPALADLWDQREKA